MELFWQRMMTTHTVVPPQLFITTLYNQAQAIASCIRLDKDAIVTNAAQVKV
jgi:hypothetical protein